MALVIRPIEAADYPLLEEFLYYTTFVPANTAAPPREIVKQPDTAVYIDGFGNNLDFGFVAELDGIVVGIAWSRLIQAYGYVDDDTPELVVALLPEYRNQGIGTQLLTQFLHELNQHGFERVSLSVERGNPAIHLYERLGFKELNQNKMDITMLKEFPPETMVGFFDARAEIYDDHMNIDMQLDEFYCAIAELCVPPNPEFRLLDLGCGTGLELELLFENYPNMRVTGIDLSQLMLDKLEQKFPDKTLELIAGSYFELDLDCDYDIVLSTYSLHHFSEAEKLELYRRIVNALKPSGFFLFGDYTVKTKAQQDSAIAKVARIRQDHRLEESEQYHLDIPFTPEAEIALMLAAGFATVRMTHQWENTSILIAYKLESTL